MSCSSTTPAVATPVLNSELARKYFLLEKYRLESYKSWPFEESVPCSTRKMAEAGFYWCGNERENDTAACFACEKVLDGWEPEDDPWVEHQKHAPQCAFVKLGRPERELLVEELLGLVNGIVENLMNKWHAQIKKKAADYCDRKREEMIKAFKG